MTRPQNPKDVSAVIVTRGDQDLTQIRASLPFDDVDHAWSAGVLDGEGCISIRTYIDRRVRKGTREQSGPAYRCHALEVRVTQSGKDVPPMLEKLCAMYGGSIGAPRAIEGRKPAHTWVIAAQKAEAMLLRVAPFLVEKREQAQLALAYRREGVGRGKQTVAARYRIALQEAKR